MEDRCIVTKFRNESVDGYDFGVLKSALQKYIRRSNLEMSLWVASRLDLFYYGENGERLRTNFIHRLMIIYLEDVGFPAIYLWRTLDKLLMDILIKKRKTKNRDRNEEIIAIKKIVYLLANDKQDKSRSCSHLKTYCELDDVTIIPIKTFSWENRFGFAKYIFSLKSDSERFNVLEKYYNRDIVNIGRKWYKEIKTKEQFLTWCIILTDMVFNPEYKNTTVVDICDNFGLTSNWDNELKIKVDEFDEWVYDKHVKPIYQYNNTSRYFAEISSIVIPESILVDQTIKSMYMKVRGVPITIEDLKDDKVIIEDDKDEIVIEDDKVEIIIEDDKDAIITWK